MYVCNDCKSVFDEDDAVSKSEDVGEYFGSPSYRSYDVCPHCESYDIEEAEKCQLCEEYGEVESYDGKCYCPECVEYIKKKFGDLITNNFNANERKMIYWCIDVETWINQN